MSTGRLLPIHGEPLDAGSFPEWLTSARNAQRAHGTSDVPCGTCTACCTSSQFVHVRADDVDALAAIPKELLFPAPGADDGSLLMGFADDGCCPMFQDGGCSIYDARPATCRTYDCRVFAAAGIDAGGDDRSKINERVSRWSFRYPEARDERAHAAVKAAAAFVMSRGDAFELGAPTHPSQIALVALQTHPLFLAGADGGSADAARSDVELARAIVAMSKAVNATDEEVA